MVCQRTIRGLLIFRTFSVLEKEERDRKAASRPQTKKPNWLFRKPVGTDTHASSCFVKLQVPPINFAGKEHTFVQFVPRVLYFRNVENRMEKEKETVVSGKCFPIKIWLWDNRHEYTLERTFRTSALILYTNMLPGEWAQMKLCPKFVRKTCIWRQYFLGVYRLSLLLGKVTEIWPHPRKSFENIWHYRKSFWIFKKPIFKKNINPSVFKNFRRLRRRKIFDPIGNLLKTFDPPLGTLGKFDPLPPHLGNLQSLFTKKSKRI